MVTCVQWCAGGWKFMASCVLSLWHSKFTKSARPIWVHREPKDRRVDCFRRVSNRLEDVHQNGNEVLDLVLRIDLFRFRWIRNQSRWGVPMRDAEEGSGMRDRNVRALRVFKHL